jgi:putative endonuclease
MADHIRKAYFVYIMTNDSRILYVGVTNNLALRVKRHQQAIDLTFTGHYHIWKLVYAEQYDDVRTAINREKQIKGWRRDKKIALVSQLNPMFHEIDPGIVSQLG